MTTELPGAVVPDMAVAEGAAPNPSEATPPRPEYSESMFAVMLGQYAVMQMVVAATALVRNKVIAVRLGPSAFGEIAQMAAVVASVVAITAFGMQVSLSRNVARARPRQSARPTWPAPTAWSWACPWWPPQRLPCSWWPATC